MEQSASMCVSTVLDDVADALQDYARLRSDPNVSHSKQTCQDALDDLWVYLRSLDTSTAHDAVETVARESNRWLAQHKSRRESMRHDESALQRTIRELERAVLGCRQGRMSRTRRMRLQKRLSTEQDTLRDVRERIDQLEWDACLHEEIVRTCRSELLPNL